MGTPYPALGSSRLVASAGFLLLPLCFESRVSVFFPPPLEVRSPHCARFGGGLGQRGEPLNCCDSRHHHASRSSEEAFLGER